jgi:hypothetical protein
LTPLRSASSICTAASDLPPEKELISSYRFKETDEWKSKNGKWIFPLNFPGCVSNQTQIENITRPSDLTVASETPL